MTTLSLISLPYAPDALQPVISAETLQFHHGRHLAGYVSTLQTLLAEHPLQGHSVEEVFLRSEGTIFNNAGQILNHNLYFESLRAPRPDNQPVGALRAAIETQFFGFDAFRKEVIQKGLSLFGSGWVFLSVSADGTLRVSQAANAHNPIEQGETPLFTLDVWEHAYYIDYRNRRADYLQSVWDILDWDAIDRRYPQR